MDRREFELLAAGHATASLDATDEAAFHEALAAHPEWASIVRADLETLAALGDELPAETPPRALRQSILDALPRLDDTDRADALDEDRPTRDDATQVTAGRSTVDVVSRRGVRTREARRRGRRGAFMLAAAVGLLVAGGVTAAVIAPLFAPPASVQALERIQDAPDARTETVAVASGGAATLHWSDAAGSAVLVTDGLQQIAGDRTFELWIIRDGTPVSAGTFTTASVDGPAVVDGAVHTGDVVAVTVERTGGAPDGIPTTDPIFAIRV